MRILIIDTHSSLSSVGIVEDERLLGEISIDEAYTHSDNLVPMIRELFQRTGLKPEDMDGFAVCKGPGSFTGLRIGMTTAKTFAQLFNKPIVGISTLKALAVKVQGEGPIVPIVDGRGGNVYYAVYEREGDVLKERVQPGFIRLKELLERDPGDFLYTGQDTALFPDLSGRSTLLPAGSIVSPLGLLALERLEAEERDELFDLSPDYLRLSQAQRDYLKKQRNCSGE